MLHELFWIKVDRKERRMHLRSDNTVIKDSDFIIHDVWPCDYESK